MAPWGPNWLNQHVGVCDCASSSMNMAPWGPNWLNQHVGVCDCASSSMNMAPSGPNWLNQHVGVCDCASSSMNMAPSGPNWLNQHVGVCDCASSSMNMVPWGPNWLNQHVGVCDCASSSMNMAPSGPNWLNQHVGVCDRASSSMNMAPSGPNWLNQYVRACAHADPAFEIFSPADLSEHILFNGWNTILRTISNHWVLVDMEYRLIIMPRHHARHSRDTHRMETILVNLQKTPHNSPLQATRRTVRHQRQVIAFTHIPRMRWQKTRLQGLYSRRRRRLAGIGIPMINLRRSYDRLRFIMGIPILIRRRLLSE